MGDTLNTTLYVGIDVSKSSNQVYALNFVQDKLLNKSFPNTESGANDIEATLLDLLGKHELTNIQIVLETTWCLLLHILLLFYLHLVNFCLIML